MGAELSQVGTGRQIVILFESVGLPYLNTENHL